MVRVAMEIVATAANIIGTIIVAQNKALSTSTAWLANQAFVTTVAASSQENNVEEGNKLIEIQSIVMIAVQLIEKSTRIVRTDDEISVLEEALNLLEINASVVIGVHGFEETVS